MEFLKRRGSSHSIYFDEQFPMPPKWFDLSDLGETVFFPSPEDEKGERGDSNASAGSGL